MNDVIQLQSIDVSVVVRSTVATRRFGVVVDPPITANRLIRAYLRLLEKVEAEFEPTTSPPGSDRQETTVSVHRGASGHSVARFAPNDRGN